VKESGWRGFFRGNGANCLKVAPESAVKFFTYETLKKVLSPGGEEHVQPQHRFIAGGLAGVAAHTTVFPLEGQK
jgi:solute carrier family 25 phosphate transporter 23/24/25/41